MSTTSIDVTPFAATLDTLASRLPPRLQKPRVGIVCGSGLSTLARSMREAVHVPYSDLPGFSTSTVQGHQSSLAFGLLGPGEGVSVVAMLGRVSRQPPRTVRRTQPSYSSIHMRDILSDRLCIPSVCWQS